MLRKSALVCIAILIAHAQQGVNLVETSRRFEMTPTVKFLAKSTVVAGRW
jgi:hypothetical protein